VERIQNALNDRGKPLKGSRIHILGVAYKRDIDDVRESPALDVMHLLQKRGARVTFSDPYISKVRIDGGVEMESTDESARREADCVVIITNHAKFDYVALVKEARLIVDTRNALKGIKSENIVRL